VIRCGQLGQGAVAVVDMMFIHRLENAIMAVLAHEQPTIPLAVPAGSGHNKEAAAFSKKVAQELYFQLDASMLIDLATYKLGENENAPSCLAQKAVA
jgi:hypothetical protein